MTAPPGIERVLFTEEQVNQRIREVAAEISAKYQGRDLKLIAILKGAVFFLTALARAIEVPLKVDFLAISSFGGATPGMVRIAKDLAQINEALKSAKFDYVVAAPADLASLREPIASSLSKPVLISMGVPAKAKETVYVALLSDAEKTRTH